MDSEESSKLISDLYNAKNRQQISDILEYMGEDGSSIFVYPLLDGYKKHKYSSVGYYFIWNLSRLDYSETGKRLNELLENYEIHKEHIPMTLFFMGERGFFSEIGNKMAEMYLDHYLDPDFRKDFGVNSLGLGCVLDYIYEADALGKFEDKLRTLVFDDTISEGEKAGALSFLLEDCQDRQIKFLIDNYAEKIKGTTLENNLAKKLLLCMSEDGSRLKSMIIENGNKEASTILLKYGDAGRREFERSGRTKTVYDCIKVTIKVGIIREQINKKTLANEHFGFPVFSLNNLLIHQAQCVDDKDIFIEMCADLLEIIRAVSPEVRNHGLGNKEMEEILAGTPDEKKDLDLAHFLLYLSAKGIGVDYDFFGLRQLDRTLTLLLENGEENKEFFEKLENIGIAHLYRKNQWHKLHGYLMNSYLQSLENMNKTFNQFLKQDLD